MKKQRKVNMKVHHKNVLQASQDMQQWVDSNLQHLGIYECHYCYYDLENYKWMTIPAIYSWYCEYLEKNFDRLISSRLKKGLNYWSPSDLVYQNYQKFVQQFNVQTPHKCDLVMPTEKGFEMLVVGVDHPLSKLEQTQLEKFLKYLSYEAHGIIKNKSNILLDLNMESAQNCELPEQPSGKLYSNYQRSKFGNIILTAKELQYIEHLMFNFTRKEIAHEHDCTETAVRRIVANIKSKLGAEFMSTSDMFKRLNKLGVLNICSQSFHVN